MDYQKLRTELTTDPVALGYSGLTDTPAAAKLNALDTGRTLNRTSVPTSEVRNAIEDGAWPDPGNASTRVSESKLRALLQMASIDASNANIRAAFGTIFPNSGATAATRTALLALATRTVSRAEELGLEAVTPVDVTRARAGVW